MTLLLAVLAVFFLWETVLSVVPWTIPNWLQPVVVLGAALAFTWPDWRLALAVSGAVGILHVLVVSRGSRGPVATIQRPSRVPRIPNLP